MAYTYTPQQNIDIAKKRVESNNAVSKTALSSYLAFAKESETQTPTETSAKNVSSFQRIAETPLDFFKSVTKGFWKALEGVWDFSTAVSGKVIQGIGNVTGLWDGDEVASAVSDFVKRDLVCETSTFIDKNLDGAEFLKTENSYINDLSEKGQRIIRGVGEGVGQMLPTLALASVTAGVPAGTQASVMANNGAEAGAKAFNIASKATKAINLGALGLSAAGTGIEQALNYSFQNEDGTVYRPTLDRAMLYGLFNGALEVATETLVGGPYEKVFGSGVADKIIGKLAKSSGVNKAVKFAIGAFGEGVEEMVSEALGNTLETIYTSQDGKVHWESPEIQDVIEAGVIGSLTSMVVSGGQAVAGKASTTVNIQDSMLDIENAHKKADNLSAQGELTAEKITELDSEIKKNVENISNRYKKILEKDTRIARKTRSGVLDSMPGIEKYIDTSTGEIKNSYALQDGVVEISPEQAMGVMSGSLAVYRRNDVANLISRYNGEIKLASSLNETERSNMVFLEKALQMTGKKIGEHLKVVAVESMSDANAFVDGDIMFISKDRLSNADTTAQDFAHEAFHFAEGTNEYKKMVEFFTSTKINGDTLLNVAIDNVRKLGYGIEEKYFDMIKNKESIESLTKEEKARYTLCATEVNAKASEILFGDYNTIAKLVERDRSFSRKLLSKLKDTVDIIKATIKGDSEKIETIKQMNKAIKYFEKALSSSGEKYLGRKAVIDYAETAEEKIAVSYSLAVDENLLSFVESVDNMKDVASKNKRKHTIGKISKRHAQMVQDLLKDKLGIEVDLSSYTIDIDGNTIQHIEKRHGVNGEQDHSMADKKDIARIGWAVNNAETCEIAYKKGEIDYDYHFRNKDGSPSPKIVLEKSITNGSLIVAECVPDTETKQIHIISAYIKKSSNGQVLNMEESSPQPTSEPPVDDYATNNSITENLENATENSKKDKKTQFSRRNNRIDPNKIDKNSKQFYNKYAPRDLSEVSKEEYSHHYWAFDNNLISNEELNVLSKAISDIKNGSTYIQNSDGLYMIPVGENSILDKIVITDGNHNGYSIDTVIKINMDNETDLDNARRLIYEQTKHNIPTENSDLFEIYYSKDFRFSDFTEKVQRNSEYSGEKRNGTRSIRKNRQSSKIDFDNSSDDVRYSKRVVIKDRVTEKQIANRISGIQLDFLGKYYAQVSSKANVFENGSEADLLANQFVVMANNPDRALQERYVDDLTKAIVNNLSATDVTPWERTESDVLSDIARKYRRKIDIDDILSELKEKCSDKELLNIRLQWKASKDVEAKVDVGTVIEELKRTGYRFKSDVKSEQFIEMLEIVKNNQVLASRTIEQNLKELLTPREYKAVYDTIKADLFSLMETKCSRKELLKLFRSAERDANNMIKQAINRAENIEKLATLEAQIAEEKAANSFSEKLKELELERDELRRRSEQYVADAAEYLEERSKLVDEAFNEAVSYREENIKKYTNATTLIDQSFLEISKRLSGIIYRGNIKKNGTREIINMLSEWYNANNPLLTQGLDEASIDSLMKNDTEAFVGYLDKQTLSLIEEIKSNLTREAKSGPNKGQQIPNNQALSNSELKALAYILKSVKHTFKTYNQVQIQGKNYVLTEQATIANDQAKMISSHIKAKTRFTERLNNALRHISTPEDIIAEMVGYRDSNPLYRAFKGIMDAADHADYISNNLRQMIQSFLNSHKKYQNRLSDTIKLANREIRKDVAISLYMLTQQTDSLDKLINGGWGYYDKSNYWVDCGKMTNEHIKQLKDSLSQADMDFIKVIRNFFDEAGRIKVETDISYKGASLTSKIESYFPIQIYKGDLAKGVSENYINDGAIAVANASINKSRVHNTHRITVGGILEITNRHAVQIGRYAGLAVPIKEFNRIYNCNTSFDGTVSSLRNTINESSWSGFHKYITELLQDVQGIKHTSSSKANEYARKIMGNIATNALGFNIKTILSQISGYPAIFAVVPPESMIKAFTHSIHYKGQNAQNMLKYCEWASNKAYDNGLILAETGAEKLGAFANFTTKGIQMMDNAMNRMIWNAAQCEVEKRTGKKFGSDANMIEAAKLHAEIGRATQGNNAKMELSAMQRSTNALEKLVSMFNSDGFKYVSKLAMAVKRVRAYHYLNKFAPGTITAGQMKMATTYVPRIATAVVVSNLVYALMGELMKHALNKDRKDKNGNEIGFWEDLAIDFSSSMVGMIPIVRDIFDYFIKGYDINDGALDAISNVTEATQEVINSVTKISKGEPYDSTDIAKPLKSVVFSVGQFIGVPTRNVYNYLYGFTKRFDPAKAYEWNSLFYNGGYSKDLKKAIDKDDIELQSTIIGLMLKEDGMTSTSSKVNEKLRALYAEGYSVLPRTVKDVIAYNGETIQLSKRNQDVFKSIYSQANDEIENLINNKALDNLANDIQAKAINWIYNYYYNKAVTETVGVEATSKAQVFGETMSPSKFALAFAACSSAEGKVDRKGQTIAGSKRVAVTKLLNRLSLTKAEKAIILAYMGYSVGDYEQLIKRYIRSIGLSKSQQTAFLSYVNF